MDNWWILPLGGLFAGLLAGVFGVGGGVVLVPMLLALGYSYEQAVAGSSLAIVMTALSGTFQNWRMGYLKLQSILFLGFPAIIMAQVGVDLVTQVPDFLKKAAFGLLLITNIFLVVLRQRLIDRRLNTENPDIPDQPMKLTLARLGTGGATGLLAGFFGVGGGVILVPLQMLLLGEDIKTAIRTSLGVVVITAIAACLGHAFNGNVLFPEGMILGLGGLIGAQVSTRYLPKLPAKVVSFTFRMMLSILAFDFFWKAWNSYQSFAFSF